MGRYDKIKVYNGSGWVKPNRIRVYANNAWQDLGTDDSANTRALNVHNGSALVRATLNRTLVTLAGESYLGGDGFRMLPKNGYCYCPNTRDYVNTTWFFRATIRKTDAGQKQVFWTGNASGSCYLFIDWLADGRIKVRIKSYYGSQNEQSVTTTNAVGANQWVYLDVTCNKGVFKMSVNFNGVVTTGYMYETWKISNADNWVGSTGVHFKDMLYMQGSVYDTGSAYKAVNTSTMSGDTADYQGADHVDTSYQEVRWT